MISESLFSSGLSRFRLLLLQDMIKRVLVSTMLLSLFLDTVLFGLQGSGLLNSHGFSIYIYIVFLSFLVLMLHTVRSKRNMINELSRIDTKFNLKELLSTAYEVFEQGSKSIFSDIIIRDAAEFLNNIKTRQIFPESFTKSHGIVLILIVIIFNIMSLYFTYKPSMPEHSPDTPLTDITSRMERYAQDNLNDADDAEQAHLFEQMNNIADDIKDHTYQDKDILLPLEDLKEKAEAERLQISRRLESGLNFGDTSETPLVNALRDDISEVELEQFRDTVDKLFEGDMPPSLSREIETLKNLREFELFLHRTIKDIELRISEGSALATFEMQEGGKDGFMLEESEESGGEAINGKPMDQQSSMIRIPPMEGSKKPATIEAEPDGSETEGEKTSSAGYGKDDVKAITKEGIEGTSNPAIMDKNLSDNGSRYSIQVLSLPLAAKAEEKEEEIMRAYEKEIESVINKEEIPENYREYIKNYFLSIGMGRGENENRNAD